MFDGISCGHLSLDEAKIKVKKYYASEIDKYCIDVTQKNYPDTIQLGDINNWRKWAIDYKSIDILLAGSPCQGFSIAGKKLSFEDSRSKLFFVFIEILEHIKQLNPKVIFLLENVKMKNEWRNVITEQIGVDPIRINSSLVSAQVRIRDYWTNIKEIKQPIDKGITLEKIIDFGYTFRKYYLMPNARQCRNYVQFDVSGKGYNSQQDRAFYTTKKFGTFSSARANTKRKVCFSAMDKQCFDLTLNECKALQTIPDYYIMPLNQDKENKALIAIGNGWNIATVAHILNNIPKEVKDWEKHHQK